MANPICPTCGAEIPDQSGYWSAQLKVERKRADQNLRLVIERTAEIYELEKKVGTLYLELDQLKNQPANG